MEPAYVWHFLLDGGPFTPQFYVLLWMMSTASTTVAKSRAANFTA